MASTIGELLVRIGLDAESLTRGLKNLNADLNSVSREAQKSFSGINKAAQSVSAVGATLTGALTVPLTAIGLSAFKAAADLDSLERGLTSVTRSSEETKNQLKSLEEVARLPGLGFKEAVQGSINLQSAGFSAQIAERALKGFGNALATVGKGRDDLNGVITALSQMASKSKVSAEEINQLAERVPQMRVVIKEAFPELADLSADAFAKAGISVDQFVEKVIAQLERLPKVTGGAKNDMENMSDQIEKSMAAIGKATLPIAKTLTDNLAPALESVTTAFTSLSPEMQDWIVKAGITAAVVGPAVFALGKVVATLGEMRLAFLALNTVVLNSPVGLALLGAAGVGGAIFALSREWDKSTESLKRMGQEVKALPFGISGVTNNLNELAGTFFATGQGSNELTGGIKVLTGGLSGLTKHGKLTEDQQKKLTASQKEAYEHYSSTFSKAIDTLIERQSAYAKATSSAADDVRKALAKTQLDVHVWNAAMENALQSQLGSLSYLRSSAKITEDIAEVYKIASGGIKEYSNALSTLGITDLNYQLEKQEEALRVVANATLNGARDYRLYQDAQLRVLETKKQLGKLTKDEAEAYRKLKAESGGAAKVLQEVSTIINDTSKGIAQAILHWGGFGDVAKKTLESIGEAILRNVINRLLESTKIIERASNLVIGLMNQIGKVIGIAGQIPKIPIKNLTGDSGDFFPGLPGGGGGTGGIGGAISGVTGILGAVGSIGSMVSGIIGNFQSARQEGTLNAIEHEVRYSQIHLSYILEEVNKYLNYLKSIHDRLFEIRMEGVMVQQNPAWGDFRVAMAGGAMAGGGNFTFNIGTYVGPGGMSQFVDLLVSELRKRGVKFG